jgi:hypothetical protein
MVKRYKIREISQPRDRETLAAVFENREVILASDYDKAIVALRAARPCVFNSRAGSWEEVLRLVDAVLDSQSDAATEQKNHDLPT